MRQYTLYEERHFNTVLTIMEAVVAGAVMQRFRPLGYAQAILDSYTHDLGVVLPQKERDALLDESTDQGKRFRKLRLPRPAIQAGPGRDPAVRSRQRREHDRGDGQEPLHPVRQELTTAARSSTKERAVMKAADSIAGMKTTMTAFGANRRETADMQFAQASSRSTTICD